MEYVKFSLEKKYIPEFFKKTVLHYMYMREENGAIQKDLEEM